MWTEKFFPWITHFVTGHSSTSDVILNDTGDFRLHTSTTKVLNSGQIPVLIKEND